MKIQYIHPADQLVMIMQRIYDKGLTTTSGGNLSMMDTEGNIWITPAGVDKGTLTRKDMVCVHPDGSCEGFHQPSSELPFHASVYKMRPDLKAVLHAHPSALLAFSVVRKVPDLDLLPAVRSICSDVRIAAYGVPGSNDLGDKIGSVFSEGCDMAILENHGVCIGAPDLFMAFQRFETLNYAAELEIVASRVGQRNPMTARLRQMAEATNHTKMGEFDPLGHSAEELSARRDMITLIRRAYRMGLVSAGLGTCSVRLEDGSFLITPYGVDRACLEDGELVRVKDGRKEVGKLPSCAVCLHEEIYKKHPEIHAVLQAYPVNAMAFAVTDAKFDTRIIPESYVLLRDIKKISCGEICSDPERMAKELTAVQPAVMVENDCVIVTGNTLLQAFDRLEVLETTARAVIGSRGLGQIVHITDQEIEDLRVAFRLEG